MWRGSGEEEGEVEASWERRREGPMVEEEEDDIVVRGAGGTSWLWIGGGREASLDAAEVWTGIG